MLKELRNMKYFSSLLKLVLAYIVLYGKITFRKHHSPYEKLKNFHLENCCQIKANNTDP